MTVFVIVVALLVAWRAGAWVRPRGSSSWERSLGRALLHRRPGRQRRVGDRRRRRVATEEARAIVAMFAAGGHDGVAHLDAGVVLQPGVMPWGHAQARFATWETQAFQLARSRVRGGGRRVDSAVRR